MDKLIVSLVESGVPRNEAKTYLQLLKFERITANKLSKALGIDRTLTYGVLNNLVEKGLANYIVQDKKKYFAASDPKNLLNEIEQKKHKLLNIIPQLHSIKKEQEIENEITVYEGKEGIRAILNLFRKQIKLEFLAFGATGRLYDALFESPALAKEFSQKGFNAKIIVGKEYSKHAFTKIPNIETKSYNFDTDATTTIFGEYVVIHTIIGKPKLILIHNKLIAESYRIYFGVLWDHAKKD